MFSIKTFYLSRILGQYLYLGDRIKLGKIQDIIVNVSFMRPKAVALQVKTKSGIELIDFNLVTVIKDQGQYSMHCSEKRSFVLDDPHCIMLKKSVLDRQIVDINGHKVVRVNDLRLAVLEDGTYLIAVDVGLEGLLRRLGIAKRLGRLLKPLGITIPNNLILWDEVETVDSGRTGIRLSTEVSNISRLHPSDVADIIDSLDRNSQMAVFTSLDHEKAADVLEELEPETQATVLGMLPIEHAADLLESMPSDEVADILDGLKDSTVQALLNEMADEASDEVRELMEYPDDSVGSIMSKDYIFFNEHQTVAHVFTSLRQSRPESDSIYYLYIINDAGQLVATVSLRDLIISDPANSLSAIMNPDVISVLDTDRIDAIIETIDKYNLLAVPVTDQKQKLKGIVIINDVVYNLLRARKRK